MKIKNFTIIAIAIFAGVVLSSCNKLKTLTFSKTFANITMEIDTTSFVGTQIELFELSGIQEFAKENGFDMNDITSVKPTKFVVDIEDNHSTPYTFDVLDYAAGSITSPGSRTELMGSIVPPKNGSTSLEIPMKDVDVQDFVKADKFNVLGTFTNNAPITHVVPVSGTLTVEITAEVKAKLFGK